MIEALVRCCAFGFLGPIAGLLTLIVSGGGSKNLALDTFVIVLLFAYLFGLVPALITAAFDEFLDGRGAKGIPKYLLTGAFGYAAAYVFPLMPLRCSTLIDHLVGVGDERRRHVEAQRLGGLEVDRQLELGRKLNWKISRFFTSQDAIDIRRGSSIHIDRVNAVGHQAATRDPK
jgi:hypothetical protein